MTILLGIIVSCFISWQLYKILFHKFINRASNTYNDNEDREAFKKFLKDKELTDLKGDVLLEAFNQIDFDVNSTRFETIRAKIQRNKLDAEVILENSEKEIIDECGLQECEEDKYKILRMRAIIRKTFALKHPIPDSKLKKAEVVNFSKQEVYNLLENKINSIDDIQSQNWYSYIEKEVLTGKSFIGQEDKKKLEKELGLTDSQKIALAILFNEIEPPVQQQAQSVTIQDAVLGAIGIGGSQVNVHGNITSLSKGSMPQNENDSKSTENKCSK